jgi:hypothetical protein
LVLVELDRDAVFERCSECGDYVVDDGVYWLQFVADRVVLGEWSSGGLGQFLMLIQSCKNGDRTSYAKPKHNFNASLSGQNAVV